MVLVVMVIKPYGCVAGDIKVGMYSVVGLVCIIRGIGVDTVCVIRVRFSDRWWC